MKNPDKQPVAKILIADDDSAIVDLLTAMLKQRGMKTLSAANGEAAFDMAFNHKPDIIILDVMMPRMNGFEVLKKLKENESTKAIPVIMLTARKAIEDISGGLSTGIIDYIVKPFKIDDVLNRIEEVRAKMRHGIVELPKKTITIGDLNNPPAENAAAKNALLGDLRLKYLAQLKERRKTIADFLSGCESNTPTEPLCDEACRQSHSLAGSGATYGFVYVTTAGRALEEALQSGIRDPHILTGLARNLLKACDQALNPETATSSTSAPAAAGKKPLLLIADDDAAQRDLLTNLFATDAKIIAAVNGREALEMAQRQKPDLIILDDAMPEMSGLKVLETLRTLPEVAQIPVVMLTASDSEKDITRGLMAGAADYITKPFDPHQLAEKIRARLARRRYTILIAEDDTNTRNLLEDRFRALGCDVLPAQDGSQALEETRRHKPSLLILDLTMPGLDGMAVLQKMRQEEAIKATPVLFLTEKYEQNLPEAPRPGAVDYLIKPFKAEDALARSLLLLKGKKA